MSEQFCIGDVVVTPDGYFADVVEVHSATERLGVHVDGARAGLAMSIPMKDAKLMWKNPDAPERMNDGRGPEGS